MNPNNNSLKNSLLIIVMTIVTIISISTAVWIAYQAGYFDKDSSSIGDRINDAIDLPGASNDVVDPADQTRLYKNSDWGVSLNYPTDWVLTEESPVEDSVLVVIEKGEYEFRLQLANGSPSICDLQDGEYRTVADSERTFMLKVDSVQQFVCEKETNSDKYVTWVQPGFISYFVPENVDPAMLVIMDQILLSYTQDDNDTTGLNGNTDTGSNGVEPKTSAVTKNFSCSGYVDGALIEDLWSFDITLPTGVVAEEVFDGCGRVTFTYDSNVLVLRVATGYHLTQLDNDYLKINSRHQIVRNPFSSTEEKVTYFTLEDDSECVPSPTNSTLAAPCGISAVDTGDANVFLELEFDDAASEAAQKAAVETADAMVASMEFSSR